MQRSWTFGMSWNFLQAPLFISMLSMAAMFETYVEGLCLSDTFVVILSLSTFTVIITLTLIGLTHTSGDPRIRSQRGCIRKQIRTTVRIVLAVLALALSLFTFWDVSSDLEGNKARTQLVAIGNTALLFAVAVFDSVGRCPGTVTILLAYRTYQSTRVPYYLLTYILTYFVVLTYLLAVTVTFEERTAYADLAQTLRATGLRADKRCCGRRCLNSNPKPRNETGFEPLEKPLVATE